LLSTFVAFRHGGKSGGHFRISIGISTVPPGWFRGVHRLWVLSIMAREAMPAPNEYYSLNPVVAVCDVRFHFDFLPAGDGKRNRWNRQSVIV
jgi:hypothetical protein